MSEQRTDVETIDDLKQKCRDLSAKFDASQEAFNGLLDRANELAHTATQVAEQMQTWKRVARENHAIVEGVIKERDQWKEMWFTQGRDHSNAQQLMMRALESAGEHLHSSFALINKMRKERGLEPISLSGDRIEALRKITEAFQASLVSGPKSVPEVDWTARMAECAPPEI